MIAEYQDKIEKVFGKTMLPSVVGNAVADQIFACRGAQLIIPKSWFWARTIRAWPVWIVSSVMGTGKAQGSKAEAAAVGARQKKAE